MAGLTDLFELVMSAVEVAPSYAADRCLNSTEGAGSCRTCLDVCPHEAVSIHKLVEIDAVDCTGCGICVRACPSQALEFDLRLVAGAAARCSRVAGTAQSVTCLAALSPTDMLRLAGPDAELTLAHGACDGCSIGGAAVPEVARRAADEAARLAALHGRELKVSIDELPRLDDERPARRKVSRRQLFGGGIRQAQRMAGDALQPLERLLPVAPEEGERDPLPLELQRSYRAIELAEPEAEELVPWRLPRVDDGCILCPACTRACPTDALSRDLTGEQGVLLLDPERCVGCDACVRACPVKVIELDDVVSWGELSGGSHEAYRASPERRSAGSFHR